MEAVTIIKYSKLKQLKQLIFLAALSCGIFMLRHFDFSGTRYSIPWIVPFIKPTLLFVILPIAFILFLISIYSIFKLKYVIILDKNGFINFSPTNNVGFISWNSVSEVSVKEFYIGIKRRKKIEQIAILLKDPEEHMQKLPRIVRFFIKLRIVPYNPIYMNLNTAATKMTINELYELMQKYRNMANE